MKTLDTKIAMLEEMIGDPKKLSKAVYDVITGSDINNDECLSKAEFQVTRTKENRDYLGQKSRHRDKPN